MKLLYLSNYFNHHQKPLAEALYGLLGDEYYFVETENVPEFRKQLGYKEMTAPYVVKYNDDTKNDLDEKIFEADVVVYGEAPLSLIKRRLAAKRLTIKDDECRYRSISRFLKWPIYTYNSLFLNKGYLLCASAYGPIDYLLSGMNPRRCFRWGYFPEVKKYKNWESLVEIKKSKKTRVRILWCGRLIKLKHPESFVYIAEHLKRDGYDFDLHVIGTGKLEQKMKSRIKEMSLEDCVFFHGSIQSEEVRTYMEQSDIFLFTSDRNEGWGAVLNESMNSGCAVVAGNNIGSVPYLIQNGINGYIFKDCNWRDLYDKVKSLLDRPEQILKLGEQAYLTMLETWNGDMAARNLVSLCESLQKGVLPKIDKGPCSHTPLLMRRWRGIIKVL